MKKLILLFAAFAFLLNTDVLQAQSVYSLSGDTELKVMGTSTLHDWEMASSKAEGRAEIETSGRSITAIKNLKVTLEAETLKSGTSRLDRNAYSALNTSSHPNITFELKEVLEIDATHVSARGDMTISGKTNTVDLKVSYRVRGNQVIFSGEHQITFSDFGIDPPTAMLGTVRTGDELDLEFSATFIK